MGILFFNGRDASRTLVVSWSRAKRRRVGNCKISMSTMYATVVAGHAGHQCVSSDQDRGRMSYRAPVYSGDEICTWKERYVSPTNHACKARNTRMSYAHTFCILRKASYSQSSASCWPVEARTLLIFLLPTLYNLRTVFEPEQ